METVEWLSRNDFIDYHHHMFSGHIFGKPYIILETSSTGLSNYFKSLAPPTYLFQLYHFKKLINRTSYFLKMLCFIV